MDGTLNADGTIFKEDETGQGWEGIVTFDDSFLGFDNVTVTDASVGVLVLSDAVFISSSTIEDNAAGIRSGYLADYCPSYPNCVGLPTGTRSAFELNDNTTVSGTVASGGSQTGVGIFARNVDAIITETVIEGNESAGLFLWNADIQTFNNNDILENGNTGAYIFNNGDLRLKDALEGSGFDCFTDNTDDEVWVDFDGYFLAGNATIGGDNSIFDDDLDSDTYLIFNETSGATIRPLDAHRTWWGTGGAPPSGAFNVGVVATSPLANDPTNCITSSRQAASVMFERTGVEDESERRDYREWLREEIRRLRGELVQALADEAGDPHTALRQLYATQRLDRTDELEEHSETMTLIASVRSLLTAGGVLSTEHRETAEAALIAGVADALRHGDLEAADELVGLHEALVEGERAARSLSLHAAMVDEAQGRIAEALARVEAVQDALDPESQEAMGVAVIAAVLAEQVDASGARGEGAVATSRTESRASQAAFELLAPYPNPSMNTVTVPITLAEAAEVRVTVYDVLGRKVVRLADERLEAGRHRLSLDGASLPAGLYLVRAEADVPGASSYTARITLVN